MDTHAAPHRVEKLWLVSLAPGCQLNHHVAGMGSLVILVAHRGGLLFSWHKEQKPQAQSV